MLRPFTQYAIAYTCIYAKTVCVNWELCTAYMLADDLELALKPSAKSIRIE